MMTGTDEEISQKRDEDEMAWVAERRTLEDELASNVKTVDDLKLRIDSLERDVLSEREANGALESKIEASENTISDAKKAAELEAARAGAFEEDFAAMKGRLEGEVSRLKKFMENKVRESEDDKRKSLERIELSERALADADTTAELEAARADKLEKEVIALKRENNDERRRSSERVDHSERALQEADKTAELEAARADELEKQVQRLKGAVEGKNATFNSLESELRRALEEKDSSFAEEIARIKAFTGVKIQEIEKLKQKLVENEEVEVLRRKLAESKEAQETLRENAKKVRVCEGRKTRAGREERSYEALRRMRLLARRFLNSSLTPL